MASPNAAQYRLSCLYFFDLLIGREVEKIKMVQQRIKIENEVILSFYTFCPT